jgi:hypothetical protein
MTPQRCTSRTLGILLTALAGFAAPAQGQEKTAPPAAPAISDAQQAAREEFLQGRRWRRAHRRFDEWLAVQQLYDADEIAAIKADFQAQVAEMPLAELEEFVEDLEESVDVLLSPEAEEARRWLAQFLSVQAMYSEEELRERRPDVLGMSADQIRGELERFHKWRAAARGAHASFDRARGLQTQSARGAQSRQPPPRERTAARARPAPRPSPYAPRRDPEPVFERPRSRFLVDPAGNLIRWGL